MSSAIGYPHRISISSKKYKDGLEHLIVYHKHLYIIERNRLRTNRSGRTTRCWRLLENTVDFSVTRKWLIVFVRLRWKATMTHPVKWAIFIITGLNHIRSLIGERYLKLNRLRCHQRHILYIYESPDRNAPFAMKTSQHHPNLSTCPMNCSCPTTS